MLGYFIKKQHKDQQHGQSMVAIKRGNQIQCQKNHGIKEAVLLDQWVKCRYQKSFRNCVM